MARSRYVVADEVPELTSWRYAARMVDAANQPVPRAAINELKLTIYADTGAKPIVNGAQDVNILNTNRGVVGETDGTFQINFLPEDAEILDDSLATETHVALVRCTYNGALDAWSREIAFKVKNLARLVA